MPKKLYCIDNRCSSLQLRDLYKTTLLATNVLSLLNHITRAYYRESIGIDFFSFSSFFTPGKNTVGDFAIYFHLKFLRRKIARSWSSGKVKQNANKNLFFCFCFLSGKITNCRQLCDLLSLDYFLEKIARLALQRKMQQKTHSNLVLNYLADIKVSYFQKDFLASLLRPKNQRNFFKDFCPSI